MIAPTRIAPQPLPTEFAVSRVTSPAGVAMVVLQINTPVGIQLYFLDLDSARDVGAKMREAAGGIILADPASAPPT